MLAERQRRITEALQGGCVLKTGGFSRSCLSEKAGEERAGDSEELRLSKQQRSTQATTIRVLICSSPFVHERIWPLSQDETNGETWA